VKLLRKYLPRLLFSLAVLALLGLAVEVSFRLAYLPPGPTNQYDPRLGWSHVPGARGVHPAEGRAIPFLYDDRGFLVTPGPAPEQARGRLLLVGDSFVEGTQVEAGDHMQRHLRDALAPLGWSALAHGVSGWGTDQECLFVLDNLPEFGWDLVGLAFFVGNDFGNNLESSYRILTKTYHKPYFTLEEEGLVLRNDPVPPEETSLFWSFLRNHSSTYRWLKEQAAPRIQATGQARARGNTPGTTVAEDLPETPEMARAVRLTEEILALLDRDLRAAGSRLFLVVIPTMQQVEAGGRYRALETLDQICAGRDIPCLQLLPALRDASDDPTGEFFLPVDRHLSPRGHEVVAGAIVEFLREEELLD
jgi:hypothetical protein